MNNLRNFAIIAHVDHGKSTLADRMLELTGTVSPGKHEEQMLDRNPISRERGITIKLAPVTMIYRDHILNLIDTPGHVDFSYEVDRTLSCVEGVVLLVDATQGIQAQTIANAYKAIEKNLTIVPVINKIDLPTADPKKTKNQLAEFLGIKDQIIEVSAKTGQNVDRLLDHLIQAIPPPSLETEQVDTSGIIFDSYFDPHRGVVAFVRVFSGEFSVGTLTKLYFGNEQFELTEVGIFRPELTPSARLRVGEIGYLVTNLKDIHHVRVGDTVMSAKSSIGPIPGYRQVKPMVYASVFSTDPNEYINLKKALEKLYLNDSSLEFSPIYSQALGAGFRVGFLGLLHADVVRERLEREFGLSLILTPPQVEYRIENGQFFEPYVKIMIFVPQIYSGSVFELTKNYRASFLTMDNKSDISMQYEMPLSEMISDFFDRLKSVTSGYASLDWEFSRYQQAEASKLTILLNQEPVEEFSEIVVIARAYDRASSITKKLKEIIPRQQYEVKIQAQYKGKIIASERISPFRKDVTKKLYGGDRTRKDKLLDKQKEGKKRMKMVGRVEIPKEAFLKLFRKG